MLFSTLAIASLATSAFALPDSQERLSAAPATYIDSANTATYLQPYAANWAGATLSRPAGTVRDVRGTFTVPTIHRPVDQPDGEYSASIWVGIDGAVCWGVSVRSGMDIVVNASGVHARGWFSADPGERMYLTSDPVHAGDRVQLRVELRDPAAGLAHGYLDNYTTKWYTNGPRTAGAPFCAQDAAWIVENSAKDGVLVPFADFTTVLFDEVDVMLTTGEHVGPEGARPIEMYQGRVLTDVDVKSSSIRVTYL
ncbi:peptidase G1 domain-containing protein [Phanerochaete sordida]|uniref:Peptidase G1 domain-containing protein n=1 Tax=Phanerochaete sordida TaxID=48140 RepID=A0A9P3LK32_9APHY|nr:peptidase G1 domain-containing protein [Phanerochaete sordida]